jgi:hypothetical protein
MVNLLTDKWSRFSSIFYEYIIVFPVLYFLMYIIYGTLSAESNYCS